MRRRRRPHRGHAHAARRELLAALEAKLLGLIDPSALTALDSKFQGRVDGIDQAIKAHMQLTKQHRAYLSAQVSAKPGEEQTFFADFKCLGAVIIKLNGAAMNEKAADEVKSMLQDLDTNVGAGMGPTALTSASRSSRTRSWLSSPPSQLPAKHL